MKLIVRYLRCQIRQLDIWDVEVKTRVGGGIQRVKNNGKRKNTLHFLGRVNRSGTFEKDRILKRKMSNYFSIGVDAKIGFRFEKKRKSSK